MKRDFGDSGDFFLSQVLQRLSLGNVPEVCRLLGRLRIPANFVQPWRRRSAF